jgi:outer membrane protein assembly factor BamB
MAPTPVGTVQDWPELTGTGDAELWGFFPSEVTPRIAKIDKTNGSELQTFPLPTLTGMPMAWAFAFFGGDFFEFLMRANESSTTVHQVNGQTQLIVNGWRHMGAYDFKTGKEIWKLTGGGDIPVPTPVVSDGLIFITNAHGPKSPVYAIRETATGDITLADGATSNAGIAWSAPRDGGYMCTPLVYRGLVYIVKYNGVLSVFEAKTGEVKFQQRLAGGTSAFTSSPIAADGKIYLASEEGRVYVLKAGPVFEVLAENDMTESVLSTPAISEGTLLYRTQNHLIAVRAAR